MTMLSITRATECTFWASWATAATPGLLAAIAGRSFVGVAGPLALCGPVGVAVNERWFAVSLFAEQAAEDAYVVFYRVETAPAALPGGEEAERLFALLEQIVEGRAVQADLKIDVTLPATLAWCPGFPRRPDPMIDAAALEFASAVSVERVGYRFVDGTGGLEEVELVYMHEEDAYAVEIRARGQFQIAPPALVPWPIEELANLVLARFFRARASAA